MDEHGLKREEVGPTFSRLQKSPKMLLWLVLPSQLYRSILCLGKGTKKSLQRRIDLKQRYPRNTAPLNSPSDSTAVF